jgi:hypothetical protein
VGSDPERTAPRLPVEPGGRFAPVGQDEERVLGSWCTATPCRRRVRLTFGSERPDCVTAAAERPRGWGGRARLLRKRLHDLAWGKGGAELQAMRSGNTSSISRLTVTQSSTG